MVKEVFKKYGVEAKEGERIFLCGKKDNWWQRGDAVGELGGPDSKIVVISRDTNSGTYETFETMVMNKEKMASGVEYVGSNGAIRQRVLSTENAIGYVGLAFLEGVKSLTINNVQLRDERHETREFGDTKITVAAQGTSHLDPRAQTAELEFFANVSRSKFIIALIPGGLPHTITDLLVSDSAPASAKGKLYATSDEARVQDLQAEADGLKLTGSFVFSPELKGTLTASYATVSVDIPL